MNKLYNRWRIEILKAVRRIAGFEYSTTGSIFHHMWTLPHRQSSSLDIIFIYLLSLKMKNLRVGCVFLSALFALCRSQRSPSITYISGDQVVDVGGTVELACSVQYGTEFSVIWLKTGKNRNDHIFLSTGTSLVVKESRFALLYDGASATYTVLIKDLQEGDAGTYACEVVLSVNNKISMETHLSVRQPPIITDNSTQSIVTTEGEPIRMECFATGFPPPKIVWRRENNALLPTGEFKFGEFEVNHHLSNCCRRCRNFSLISTFRLSQ